jgi:hypothetical protein
MPIISVKIERRERVEYWTQINCRVQKKLPWKQYVYSLKSTSGNPMYTDASWWWRQYAPLKGRSTTMRLHDAISQKTPIFILDAVRTWSLTCNIAWLSKAYDYCGIYTQLINAFSPCFANSPHSLQEARFYRAVWHGPFCKRKTWATL